EQARLAAESEEQARLAAEAERRAADEQARRAAEEDARRAAEAGQARLAAEGGGIRPASRRRPRRRLAVLPRWSVNARLPRSWPAVLPRRRSRRVSLPRRSGERRGV